MSSPGDSSGTVRHADLFEVLWKQLGECHQSTVQELEAKVSKLKKDRCLDAQKLEVFYNRNQQLKEQNKTLQDTIGLLEERLRAAERDQCAVFEEKLKSNQEQNLHIVTKLKNERNRLEEENRKLLNELQQLKSAHPTSEVGSPEQEEGFIPDSPVLPSSLPVPNKLKKRKHGDKVKHFRYAEMSPRQRDNLLFYEQNKKAARDGRNPRKTEVLVPNTCELDAPQTSNDVNEGVLEAIPDTCGFELANNLIVKETAPDHQRASRSSWKHNAHLKPYERSSVSTLTHSPDSTTERSLSVLPPVKRFLEEGSVCSSKHKKDESVSQRLCEAGIQGGGKHEHPRDVNQTATSVCEPPCFIFQGQSAEHIGTSQKARAPGFSSDFKKPPSKSKSETDGKKKTPLQDQDASHKQPKDGEILSFTVLISSCWISNSSLLKLDLSGFSVDEQLTVEPAWSIDPALALSVYNSEQRRDEEIEEQRHHRDLADTDCTWVSHSMLQRRGGDGPSRGDTKSGLGQKANDSLDMMFDTTAYGEYKSQLDRSRPDEEDEGQDEEEEPHDEDPRSRSGRPTFKHVAVIRKKDERRKLKGTTCKECDVYYAHLPEEEKQKKLSACSRHRYLHIPPCTPENFWEVGFPSTQTCVERGYIKEETNPQARSRRRQPFNVLFSPKQRQQQT
ncbi:transcript variant X2 [Nothobranchius furzeri]|uniref:DNA endonuclease RBBP8 n=1 Tax=Nothobranchius furzeri TaxID=105023 RepID=A0A9D3BKT2_NOTFU|nr:transcript variant X2 [Nothobranchius furzeri]